MFNDKQLEILNSALDKNRIKTRSKGNIQLSYLEGHDIIDTANRIFGFGNWEYTITSLEMVSQEVNQNKNNVICYKAIVKVSVFNQDHSQQVSREDVGFGTGIAKTFADAHEGGAKEAVTDCIKRSLKSYGNQLGLSLYSKDKNTNNQHYSNPQQANNYQEQTNQTNNQSHPKKQYTQQPYQHQQDFTQLTNLGLAVMQQGENLIVVGDGAFEHKEIIKQNGFRWDGTSKSWYMLLRQAS